jgi:hypothetical protein
MVPPEETSRACEIVARLGAFVDHAAVGGFDSYGTAVEDATVAVAGIGGEDNTLPIRRYAGLEVAQPAWLELRGDGETARADLHHQLRRRLPRLASSVCLDYFSQERVAAHHVSLSGLAAKGLERLGDTIAGALPEEVPAVAGQDGQVFGECCLESLVVGLTEGGAAGR